MVKKKKQLKNMQRMTLMLLYADESIPVLMLHLFKFLIHLEGYPPSVW